MKSNTINSFLLFSLLIMGITMVSCEKNEVQRSGDHPDNTIPVTNRSVDDCEDCPDVHCCCAVELLDGDPANLLLCGVYTAMIGSACGPFTPPGNCPTVSGITSSISLSSSNTRGLFCLGTGGAFRLENTGSNTVTIRITCQYDDITPDWENIELDPDEVIYFDSNGSCFLEECN